MNLWLIRTVRNVIAGPYESDQVRQLIREGRLDLEDEICPASGYWISLHEREEIRSQLGIEVPKSNDSSDEEITETQTVNYTEALHGPHPTAASQPPAKQEHEEFPKPMSAEELNEMFPELVGGDDVQTSVIDTSASGSGPGTSPLRVRAGGQRVVVQSAEKNLERPQVSLVLSSIERPSIWRGLIWFLLFAILVVVFAVLKLMR